MLQRKGFAVGAETRFGNGAGKKNTIIKSVGIAVLTALFCIGCGDNGTGDDGKRETDGTGSDLTDNVNGVEFVMVSVEGGTFMMGCTDEQGVDCRSNEQPEHSVTLSDFYIAKYEVTQKLWDAVMGSLPTSVDSSRGIGDNYPVYYVSWNDVQAFIDNLNAKTGKTYRLPTEAEWEFAARGGNKIGAYKYSGSDTLGNVAWHGGNSGSTTHPVGTKNPNELGIYDMSGNVREWVSDFFGINYYSSSPANDPSGPSTGTTRVWRGGGWGDDTQYCRVFHRDHSAPVSERTPSLGFRLALSP